MLTLLLTVVFVLVCFLLVVVVLLQTGKGGGVSGAFGIGHASQTIFGASNAGNVLTRATAILGGAFMLLSLLLALQSNSGAPGRSRRSILQDGLGTVPATGAPAATPPGAAPSTPTPAAPGTGIPVTTPGTTPATGATGN